MACDLKVYYIGMDLAQIEASFKAKLYQKRWKYWFRDLFTLANKYIGKNIECAQEFFSFAFVSI
jgi:hypothetical protein